MPIGQIFYPINIIGFFIIMADSLDIRDEGKHLHRDPLKSIRRVAIKGQPDAVRKKCRLKRGH
jgi:hypothetical protein